MGAKFAHIYSNYPMNADEADFCEDNLYVGKEAERLIVHALCIENRAKTA